MEDITIWLAFTGGLISFFSPCCLPLYPTFISYITGISVSDLKKNELKIRSVALKHSVAFVLGFSIVFYLVGFSASYFGKAFVQYNDLLRMLGAIFIITMGLFMIGIFSPEFLLKEKRLPFVKKSGNLLNSFLVGLIFAAGWTPCIGPIFGAIIYANVLYPSETFINITAFSLGFGIPFIIMALFISKVKLLTKYSSGFLKLGGILMIAIGLILFFNKMFYLNIWMNRIIELFE